MALNERGARLALAAVCIALVAAVAQVDLATLAGGRFWGDGATYHSMAWSLARDGDLRYEAKDLLRVQREFPSGPQGLFLKRASGGFVLDAGFPWLRRVPESRPELYFAKPLLYPLMAAPLVRIFGTRGLLLTNALALVACLVLGYVELRRREAPAAALVVSLVLFLASVAPVYLLWPTPELLNMALVAGALAAWSRERPTLSAVLLGLAIYSKPYNVWLALPLGLSALIPWTWRGLGRGLLEGARRALVVIVVAAALFGLNWAITGEWNYQGGRERKTFYGRFPFEREVEDGVAREVTFGNSGTWMSTNELGPRVEAEQALASAPAPSQGAEPPRSREEIRLSFLRNLYYFWVGRFGGALPYFPAFVAALVAFLLIGPRSREGWLALVALGVSFVFYVAMIPDQWYGGTGTVGNRYFLNLLPLGLFLVPRGRAWLVAAVGSALALVFLIPIWRAPMEHSVHPGIHTLHGAFRVLPAELTMLNDLSIFEQTWRKKQPIGDTEGDAHKHWPADPKAHYLYFLDDGSFGREEGSGGPGFWLRGGADAEVILRALEPVRRLRLMVTGGPVGDTVTVAIGGRELTVEAPAGRGAEATLEPPSPGFPYKDTFVHVLRFRSQRGAVPPPATGEARRLGAFVQIRLEVDRRPRR
jgi:hypothetical protein